MSGKSIHIVTYPQTTGIWLFSSKDIERKNEECIFLSNVDCNFLTFSTVLARNLGSVQFGFGWRQTTRWGICCKVGFSSVGAFNDWTKCNRTIVSNCRLMMKTGDLDAAPE
jgi:hypothetical protein